eukprot:403366163
MLENTQSQVQQPVIQTQEVKTSFWSDVEKLDSLLTQQLHGNFSDQISQNQKQRLGSQQAQTLNLPAKEIQILQKHCAHSQLDITTNNVEFIELDNKKQTKLQESSQNLIKEIDGVKLPMRVLKIECIPKCGIPLVQDLTTLKEMKFHYDFKDPNAQLPHESLEKDPNILPKALTQFVIDALQFAGQYSAQSLIKYEQRTWYDAIEKKDYIFDTEVIYESVHGDIVKYTKISTQPVAQYKLEMIQQYQASDQLHESANKIKFDNQSENKNDYFQQSNAHKELLTSNKYVAESKEHKNEIQHIM